MTDEIAIFWDFENVKAKDACISLAKAIIEYTNSQGHAIIKKIYSNWRGISNTIIQILTSLGFDIIQVSMGKTNSVDIRLVVDCLTIAQERQEISHFVLITGDKDYIPVVSWLQKRSKKVTIIGRKKSISEHLVLSADKFISLNELFKTYNSFGKKLSETDTELIKFDECIPFLIESIKLANNQKLPPKLFLIDVFMKNISNGKYQTHSYVLKPDNFGTFTSFDHFVDEVKRIKKIKIEMINDEKHLLLPDQEPIVKDDWFKILKIIEKEFQEKQRNHKFTYLNKILHKAKLNGEFTYSNKILKNAIEKLNTVNVLSQLGDQSFKLSENYQENFNIFIENLE